MLFLMHAFLAALVQTVVLSELSLRVIHSTISMLMSAYPAVLAKLPALQVLSLKADPHRKIIRLY